MYRIIRVAALASLASSITLATAFAQGGPACGRLEGQLAALEGQRASADQVRRYEDAIGRQRQELDRTVAMARGMGCGTRFLFGPPPPPQCRDLNARIQSMQNNLDKLSSELQRARGGDGAREARRREVIGLLAANGCGAQYQAAAAPVRAARPTGLFGLLFGNRGEEWEEQQAVPGAPPPGTDIPRSSSYRTVCVRLCDGFFFPVSYSASQSRFGQDEQICKKTCPGTEAALYAYPNPGGSIEHASSTAGQPYSKLPNAFKYQKEFVDDCSCKPANMTWAEALVGADDQTVRKGDIVVDEARAKAMSQPQGGARGASPAEAGRAVQDAANGAAPPAPPSGGRRGQAREREAVVEEPLPDVFSQPEQRSAVSGGQTLAPAR